MQSSVVLALITALMLLSSSCSAVKTRIDAKKIECFSQDVEAGASIAFSFQVLHGGQKDLDVFLTATSVEERDDASNSKHHISSLSHETNTRVLEEWKQASEGRSTFTAPSASTNGHGLPTKVSACFNNKMSSWTPKWYEFELFTDPSEPAAAEKEALATAETQIEHALHKEGNNLFSVRTMMQRLKHSEQEHRDKVESTNEWVLYGTIVNGLLLMALSIFQFWYLKKFLSVRHISMRL
jgi:p24 family protein beta-1